MDALVSATGWVLPVIAIFAILNLESWIHAWRGTTPALEYEDRLEEDEEPTGEEMYELGYDNAAGYLLQGSDPEDLEEHLCHEWSFDYDEGVSSALASWKRVTQTRKEQS